MADVKKNPARLQQLESWMRSYKPEEHFDRNGTLLPELRALAPGGPRRMGSNPHANGGVLKRNLRMPDFRQYAFKLDYPGVARADNTRPLGAFLRDIMKANMTNFRVFGPDENSSNRLDAIYQVSKKLWLSQYLPEDKDGGELTPDGRVIEMLSEHTVEGMLEGYLLTGRHGFLSTYEAFAHVIDSMFNQHAKWLSICNLLPWRQSIASLNLLITSTVWRQDHNGFTHQDPGFLDVVVNKSPEVTRIYLPPDINSLLSVADHCLRSENYVNVIVCDKQAHLQYLTMEEAIKHCTKGLSIWAKASNDQGGEPDLVMACAGDVPTQEALAAVVLLREEFPDLKIRFVNVVEPLQAGSPPEDHPHGLSDADFDSIFTVDKPVLFNFHGYPWLIHRLAYRRTEPREHPRPPATRSGATSTRRSELAIENGIDRFSWPSKRSIACRSSSGSARTPKEKFRNQQLDCVSYAHEHGEDPPEVAGWTWPSEEKTED
jgi:xylulose-5-phosphate/fructose-6-phosphate phosphoketolase